MKRMPLFGAICAILCLAPAPAFGAISAAWVPIASGNGSVGTTYPAAAIAADAALLNLQTWDLHVTTDGNWASAGLRAVLPAGNRFYRSTSTGITKPEVTTANREFWTFVAVPHDLKAPVSPVLGGFPEGQPVSNGTANGMNIPGTLSVSWGELVNDPPGTYQIVRLTFPLGVVPDVLTADQSSNFSNTSQVSPDSTVAIPEIPEPMSAALAVIALCAYGLARRR